MTLSELKSWKGRVFTAEELMTERLVAGFRATLAPHLMPVAEGEAPLAAHWCLFPTDALMSELGADGHPLRYPYLPPPPLPRRMWAGGRLQTLMPLRVGDMVRRTTTIADIARKEGGTGELWFVTLEHDYETARGLAIRERQDIVYRAPVAPGAKAAQAPAREAEDLPVVWRIGTPPPLLFRYSALIFVAHRIHYDLAYATGVEGYEGLVVHGPLQASLLLNAVAQVRGAPPAHFAYRGLAPAIGDRDLSICVDKEGHRFHSRSAAGVHMAGTAE